MRIHADKHNCFRENIFLYIREGMCKCLYNLCFTEHEKCEDTRKFVVLSLHSLCIERGDWNFLRNVVTIYQNTRCHTEGDIQLPDNLKHIEKKLADVYHGLICPTMLIDDI
jgi:hypothetical protein